MGEDGDLVPIHCSSYIVAGFLLVACLTLKALQQQLGLRQAHQRATAHLLNLRA